MPRIKLKNKQKATPLGTLTLIPSRSHRIRLLQFKKYNRRLKILRQTITYWTWVSVRLQNLRTFQWTISKQMPSKQRVQTGLMIFCKALSKMRQTCCKTRTNFPHMHTWTEIITWNCKGGAKLQTNTTERALILLQFNSLKTRQ